MLDFPANGLNYIYSLPELTSFFQDRQKLIDEFQIFSECPKTSVKGKGKIILIENQVEIIKRIM